MKKNHFSDSYRPGQLLRHGSARRNEHELASFYQDIDGCFAHTRKTGPAPLPHKGEQAPQEYMLAAAGHCHHDPHGKRHHLSSSSH